MSGDAGIFGPDSVAWRIHADPAMLVGGLRALLVQALEPRAMAAVDQHSKFREDPWGRLERTTNFVVATTYGDTAAAEAAAAPCAGCTSTSTASIPSPAQAYAGNDPDLLLWIHAVEVDSFLLAYRTYAGRVTTADADRYVAEMARVAEMVELPPGRAPQSEGELRDYLRSVRGLRLTPAAVDGLRVVHVPADGPEVPAAVGDPHHGRDRDPAARTHDGSTASRGSRRRRSRCGRRCSRSAGC